MIKSELVNMIDEYGDIVINEDEAISFMLKGVDINGVMVSDEESVEKYQHMSNLIDGESPTINTPKSHMMEPNKYLRRQSKKWTIPPEYMYMDIVTYLVDKCSNDTEKKRVADELVEFERRNEIEILKVMVYIVDKFRENGIVWGVGRGSSVSCFCLYLIGINKINPLVYDISYTEFFKE